MAIFEWRKFNFVDLKPAADKGQVAEALKDTEIVCGTSGKSQIILCDSNGCIHVFYRNWEYISFKGHHFPIFLCAISLQHNLLITIANEEIGDVPLFKVWSLSKITKDNGAPCLRAVKTGLQKPTALAVSENGQYMAIGYETGNISLYRGDIARDRSKTVKSLSNKTSAITGICFKSQGKITHMFACSQSGIVVYNLQNKDREPLVELDKKYAPARCCALQTPQPPYDAHFMVGKDDAVYCYTVDGRGPCYALEGEKLIIQWFRSHLLTITKTTKSKVSSQRGNTAILEYMLTVIDIQNKCIVYSAPMGTIIAVLIEFGNCYILTKTKEVYQLDEKDLQSKLNLLFKKNFYDIAIRIAKSQQYDSESLAGIFKQYGDHLYAKGNYSGAVEQYTKTIGYLEPSYIIRRFLDSRHINYLTDYLQELHKQRRATADHTTLLLNCFTRLDLTDKLEEFLSNDNNPDVMFDLDVAIKVCRNAPGEQALSLAKRKQKHDHCISILIEDMNAYEEALEYISTLSFHDAEESLKKYGNVLMENCPDRTSELLKRLCTSYKLNEKNDALVIDTTEYTERVNPEKFIHLFFKSPDKLKDFLEHLVTSINNCSSIVYNTLIELYLKSWQKSKSTNDEMRLMDLLRTYEDVYDKNHILVLCRVFKFWPGVMWIYEEENLYHLIVRHYLQIRDYENLLQCCKRLGTDHPSLWLQALTGLRSDTEAPPNLLYQILNVIGTEKLQSPLQVLNCLAVENGPKLSAVREYFLQIFQKEAESAKQKEQQVDQLRNDLESVKQHIENLRSKPIEFRSNVCDMCHQPLTIPAVYLLCQHSFHQDCIRSYSENEKDCTVCNSRNSQLLEAIREQNDSRNKHELFHNILGRSHDPFSIVAKYFGQGLFNKIVIIDEGENQEINQNTIPAGRRTGTDTLIGSVGPGAEAKMRLTETLVTSNQQISSRMVIPSEARLRVEEASKYTKIAITDLNILEGGTKYNSSPKMPSKATPKVFGKKNTISKNISNPSKSGANPFEVDDYDKSKNPFEADADNSQNSSNEYDKNLNPFASDN